MLILFSHPYISLSGGLYFWISTRNLYGFILLQTSYSMKFFITQISPASYYFLIHRCSVTPSVYVPPLTSEIKFPTYTLSQAKLEYVYLNLYFLDSRREYNNNNIDNNKLRGFSPRANCTDRATNACRQS
jgi:hypothetical protein